MALVFGILDGKQREVALLGESRAGSGRGKHTKGRSPPLDWRQARRPMRAGRLDDAAQAAIRALELARAHQERGHQAYALRLLGEVAAHREPSEIEPAETHYLQATALAEELGMRPLVAHCRLGLGRLARRTDRSEQARAHLTAAKTLYREMDMRSWLARAEAE